MAVKLFEDNKEAIAHTGNVIESTQFMTFKNNLSDATKNTKSPRVRTPHCLSINALQLILLGSILRLQIVDCSTDVV